MEFFENLKIIGIKYINVDFYLFEWVCNVFLDKFILFGFDEMFLFVFVLNVDGCIGLMYNLNVLCVCEEMDVFEVGDIDKVC